MFNDWFNIGPFTVHGYGVMVAAGILSALSLATYLAKRNGLEYQKMDNFALVAIISGFAVSKLVYVLTVFDDFLKDPLTVLGGGGWVVYGAIIGGILGAYLYSRKHGWDYAKVLNVIIPCLPLAQAIGRIGCFFAGCCYGKPTDAWYGVTFPADSLCPVNTSVIPTQLIMSLGDFIIFGILFYRTVKKNKIDNNVAIYLMLYSIGRFFVEFIRGDTARGFIGPLSTSQFIGIFIFLLGFIMYFRTNHKNIEESH